MVVYSVCFTLVALSDLVMFLYILLALLLVIDLEGVQEPFGPFTGNRSRGSSGAFWPFYW